MPRRSMYAILVAALMLGAACGGGGEEPEATSSPTSSPTATESPTPDDGGDGGAETELDLVAQNNEFDEDELTAPAGAAVAVTVENEDALPHNFSVYASEEAQESIFVGDPFTGPDESMTYEFDAPAEPGTYFFRCDIHPTTMTGDFITE